jgi:hypothetical protein
MKKRSLEAARTVPQALSRYGQTFRRFRPLFEIIWDADLWAWLTGDLLRKQM